MQTIYLKILLKNLNSNNVEVFPSHKYHILKGQSILMINQIFEMKFYKKNQPVINICLIFKAELEKTKKVIIDLDPYQKDHQRKLVDGVFNLNLNIGYAMPILNIKFCPVLVDLESRVQMILKSKNQPPRQRQTQYQNQRNYISNETSREYTYPILQSYKNEIETQLTSERHV